MNKEMSPYEKIFPLICHPLANATPLNLLPLALAYNASWNQLMYFPPTRNELHLKRFPYFFVDPDLSPDQYDTLQTVASPNHARNGFSDMILQFIIIDLCPSLLRPIY